MKRVWSCVFYGLCVFAIAFSLFWIALPELETPEPDSAEEPIASQPGVAAQAEPEQQAAADIYYLCDEGGRVAVYACGENGKPITRVELTSIYVNLLPESDALRVKSGLTVYGEKALSLLLEDLGR